MSVKKFLCVAGVFLLAAGFASMGLASDGKDREGIMVQAPLDAVNCATTPATATVLGLNIDVTNARFGGGWRHKKSCTDLVVGKVVEMELVSDTPDSVTGLLTAQEAETLGGHWNGVKIGAPIQTIDVSGTSVTVLGLAIDITKATLVNDGVHPILTSQLAVGQFAGLSLPSNQAPLAAAKLSVDFDQVKVQAPLDAIDCAATPATVTVLGLAIDASKASFTAPKWHHNKGATVTCADLVAGQVVDVFLTSDVPVSGNPMLAATEVGIAGGRKNIVEIDAPFQAVDAGGANVTVLGLAIDITKAALTNGERDPILASQLKVGQFASVEMPSNIAPLAAAEVEVAINQVKVRGPVDAVNCAATPATATVLGLNIDISNAAGTSSSGWRGKTGDTFTCAGLTVGQTVEVALTSDISDPGTGLFTATEVKARDYYHNVLADAPLQSIDISGTVITITVLGLPVDISTATLTDDMGRPITASQLMLGQFVKLNLTSNQAPLAATRLMTLPATNEVEVHVMDETGKPVNDGTRDVRVVVTVVSKKKVTRMKAVGSGTFHLASLPAGQVRVVVARVKKGKISSAAVAFAVKADSRKTVTLQLKKVN